MRLSSVEWWSLLLLLGGAAAARHPPLWVGSLASSCWSCCLPSPPLGGAASPEKKQQTKGEINYHHYPRGRRRRSTIQKKVRGRTTAPPNGEVKQKHHTKMRRPISTTQQGRKIKTAPPEGRRKDHDPTELYLTSVSLSKLNLNFECLLELDSMKFFHYIQQRRRPLHPNQGRQKKAAPPQVKRWESTTGAAFFRMLSAVLLSSVPFGWPGRQFFKKIK